MHESDTVLIDNGRVRIQRGFLDLLHHHGLDSFNAVMLFSHGRPIRAVPGRTTQRIELPAPFDISNAMLICPQCGKPTRVAYAITKGKKVRMCKKCNKEI